MTVAEMVRVTDANILLGAEHQDRQFSSAFCSDLMSDVLAFVNEDTVLITGLMNPHVIRTSEMLDLKCIIFVRGKQPSQEILDAAVAAKAKSIDEVNNLTLANGQTVAAAITERSGVTGEKMELDGYLFLEGDNVSVYNHMNKNTLCTMVQTNKPAEEQAHAVAMQVAAMKPVALSEKDVDPAIIEEEKKVAAEKTKQEPLQKAIDNKLKKAGINPAHVDSEDHMESNMAKGWITAEDVAKAKEIIASTTVEIPEQMLAGIVNGRVNKFYKESCLLNQEFIQDSKMAVKDYLKAADKDLTVVAFKRFSLQAD